MSLRTGIPVSVLEGEDEQVLLTMIDLLAPARPDDDEEN